MKRREFLKAAGATILAGPFASKAERVARLPHFWEGIAGPPGSGMPVIVKDVDRIEFEKRPGLGNAPWNATCSCK